MIWDIIICGTSGHYHFWFINPPENELIKIENLLIWALTEEKTLTYRSFYAKK